MVLAAVHFVGQEAFPAVAFAVCGKAYPAARARSLRKRRGANAKPAFHNAVILLHVDVIFPLNVEIQANHEAVVLAKIEGVHLQRGGRPCASRRRLVVYLAHGVARAVIAYARKRKRVAYQRMVRYMLAYRRGDRRQHGRGFHQLGVDRQLHGGFKRDWVSVRKDGNRVQRENSAAQAGYLVCPFYLHKRQKVNAAYKMLHIAALRLNAVDGKPAVKIALYIHKEKRKKRPVIYCFRHVNGIARKNLVFGKFARVGKPAYCKRAQELQKPVKPVGKRGKRHHFQYVGDKSYYFNSHGFRKCRRSALPWERERRQEFLL